MSLHPKRALALLAVPIIAALAPCAASAHASFEMAEASQNSTYKAVLRLPHGCEGQPTNLVRITIPEGLIAVKPMPKAGWSLATTAGDLGKTYQLHGREVKTGVKEIVWSGGSLPDAHYDEFVFQARVTDALPAGETLFIPVVQECASAKAAWIEIAAKGQDRHDLKMPAPGIRIMAQARTDAHGHGAHGAPSTASGVLKAGSLLITQPWSRATPAGARVGGGYMTITNQGPQADRLVGGSLEIAGAFEVHEMRMEGNVMRMRALDKGLEIKPGETVELKPGGYHLMLLDLKRPLKEGERIKGQLVFEKAGRIDVEYRIEPRGGADHSGHGAHGGHGMQGDHHGGKAP